MKTKNFILIANLIFVINSAFAQLGYQTAGYYYYDASFNELEQNSNSIEAIIDAGELTGFCIASAGLGVNSSGAVVEGTHILKTDLDGSVVTNGDLFIPGMLYCSGFKTPLKVKNDYAYVAGRFTNMASDFLSIVKIYLPTMSIIWQKTEDIVYHGDETPIAIEAVGGSLYITGTVNNDAAEYDSYDSDANAFLMKMNASTGVVSWVNEIYGNYTPQAIYANQVDVGHEVYVVGNVYSEGFSDVTMFVYKANHLGATSFSYTYDIKGIFEEALSIIQLTNGNYLVVGTTIYGCSNGPDNVLAMEINSSGDVVKSNIYGSLDENQPNWIGLAGTLSTSSDGSVYICGFELGDGGIYNSLILAIDDDLVCNWAITTGLSVENEKYLDLVAVCSDAPNYDCSSSSAPAIVAIGLGDNDTYVGQTYVSTVSNLGVTEDDCDQTEDFYTNTVVVKRYQGQSIYPMIRDPYQNTFITKLSTPVEDYICFDYYEKLNSNSSDEEDLVKTEIISVTVSPNPTANPLTLTIEGDLEKLPGQISIFDINGVQIYSEKVNELSNNKIITLADKYSDGLYYLVIDINNTSRITKAFILQKI